MPYKRSYVLTPGAERTRLESDVRAPLEADGIRAALVFSHDPEAGIELLDVLPADGTKLHAVRHVREALDVPLAGTVYAGDSGNDLDVLVSDVPAVLVANGDAATRQAAVGGVRASGREDRLYLAGEGVDASRYGRLSGCYAGGIVEGLVHFHPALASRFDD